MAVDSRARYFKSDENRETITKRKFKQNEPLKTRKYIYSSTGAVYEGTWKGGLRHGIGTMTWPDGATFTGKWEYNYACGKGKFVHADGDVYEGSWLNSKANGFGVYTNIKGSRYEGQWKDDQQDGQGYEIRPEGGSYRGSYLQGKKHGKGKYVYADGSKYDGEWFEN